MELIELECPGCKELLEIDAGFAGGVCRCSTCGTLMTVPAAASNEAPEQLTRPDRPDAPPGRDRSRKRSSRPSTVAAPDAPTGLHRAADDAIPSDATPSESAPGSLPRTKSARHATHVSVEGDMPSSGGFTYITSTGRQVHIHHAAIPTAQKRKRKVVRATTYLLIFGALAAVIGVTMFAIVTLVAPEPEAPFDDGLTITATQMASFNPFLDTKPRFLGVPLTQRPVIAVDASGSSEQWYGPIQHALVKAALNLPTGHALQVILWTYDGPVAYPRQLRPWNASDLRGLLQVMHDTRPGGTVDPTAAIEKAAEAHPTQVILVTSQQLDYYLVGDLQRMLEEQEGGFRLDAVTIGSSSADLRRLAEEHGGRYFSYSERQFRQWWDDYRQSESMLDLETILSQRGPEPDPEPAPPLAPQAAATPAPAPAKSNPEDAAVPPATPPPSSTSSESSAPSTDD